VRAAFAASRANAAAPWSAETSGGRSREAHGATEGFQNLAGNLAEWLQPAGDAGDNAPIIGGSYLDPASSLATLPITALGKRERARHVGFRVVIEPAR
jgi:hypothetical protein